MLLQKDLPKNNKPDPFLLVAVKCLESMAVGSAFIWPFKKMSIIIMQDNAQQSVLIACKYTFHIYKDVTETT